MCGILGRGEGDPICLAVDAANAVQTLARVTSQQEATRFNPKVVIPMHFKTPDLAASLASVLAPVDDFVKAIGNTASVSEVGQSVTFERGKLSAGRTIMVMKYK